MMTSEVIQTESVDQKRRFLNKYLKELESGQQNRFKQMYANHVDIQAKFSEKMGCEMAVIVDSIPEEKLNHAMDQVESTLIKNRVKD